MIMSLKQREINFKPRIKLNQNMYATEIQKHLIENQVVDLQRFDKSCIDT